MQMKAVVAPLAIAGVGIIIGPSTEYYTSSHYKPTKSIAGAAVGGPATAVIAGIGVGMLSTVIPVLAVGLVTILSFMFASGFDVAHMNQGLYGVAIAAVGMLLIKLKSIVSIVMTGVAVSYHLV